MSENVAGDRRASPRVAVEVDLQLARKVGKAVTARTLDVSAGGARVLSSRPLRVFEELRFELMLAADGTPLQGMARVLRQDLHDVYALRFEQMSEVTRRNLEAFIDAGAC